MRHLLIAFASSFLMIGTAQAQNDFVLEAYTYHEDFESQLLGSWASYPLWQDIAYDPNFRFNTIVPGDPNLSLEQRVTPYTNVDNYAGAQKLLDMYLVPGSSVRLRYYLKSHLPFEHFKIRLAAGSDGKVDRTFPDPGTNEWVWVTATFEDFVRENPQLEGRDRLKVNALAVLAKLPNADPAMPFYFGLDDVTVAGARAAHFRFVEPSVTKLPDYAPYIPNKHYFPGDRFVLRGAWGIGASRVEMSVAPFTERDKTVFTADLRQQREIWSLPPTTLDWNHGLYMATLRAYSGGGTDPRILSETQFTIHIAPRNIGGTHPRLWFDSVGVQEIDRRLRTPRFQGVRDQIARNAATQREQVPLERLDYDLDQYPDEDWLPSWRAYGTRIHGTGEAAHWNALAYVFHGDREAGEYAKNVLLRISDYPTWHHPWQIKRGRWADHRTGAWSHRLALAYDLTYDLMTESERSKVRGALMEHIVEATYLSYVWDNLITANTSNWLAMIAGGSLMVQAAVFGDGPDVENLEPYFTGTVLKLYEFLERVTERGEAWGEGFGYNNYSFTNLSRSLPSLENVFNVDLHQPVATPYMEYIWAGPIREKRHFYYGDSRPGLSNPHNWNWLLAKARDPLLSWFTNFLKDGEDFMDVLYDTSGIPQQDPFGMNPVRLFREVGTTVFKSGWESDDFIFVLRSGPFYNHQHLDQGSFWLADRGSTFIQKRTGSDYYDDPLYQPWFTQPINYSTILINDNHQSQRVGDHKNFAAGFHDHAFVGHFLDSGFASFTSGDIGRLYWDKVVSLERNVLYLKPRTVILLDRVIPLRHTSDMTMLFQTLRLDDITADQRRSTISKDGNTLHIMHLTPEMQVEAREAPHFLRTLQQVEPLEKAGMLVVATPVAGRPLVAANLLTTTTATEQPDVHYTSGRDHVSGTAGGTAFAFATTPGALYETGGISTDCTAVSWQGETVFAAQCRTLSRDERLRVSSSTPVTLTIGADSIKYYLGEDAEVSFGAISRPTEVQVNGQSTANVGWDSSNNTFTITLSAGEGTVTFR